MSRTSSRRIRRWLRSYAPHPRRQSDVCSRKSVRDKQGATMQMQMNVKDSVSFLSQEAIESIALYFLTSYFAAKNNPFFPPIPVDVILEKHLKSSLGFGDLHKMLNVPRKGIEPDVLGALWVDSGEVLIDEYLDPDIDPTKEG